jgi:hypothetical protein
MNDMHDGLHDTAHDDGISRIYQKSRIEEPPMRLDSAILSQAKEAVEKKPRTWMRIGWIAPLVTTAVALLTVSLVIQMKQEHPEAIAPAPAPQIDERLKDDLRQAEPTKTLKRKPAAPAHEMEQPLNEMKAAPARGLVEQPKKEGAAGRPEVRMRDNTVETDSIMPTMGSPAAVQAILEAEAHLEPEKWIEKIRSLLEQDKTDVALKELEAFKATYPDYKLPADLMVIAE